MRIIVDRVKVSVPATTVDLGPAFDGLGLALGLRDEVGVRALAGGSQVRVVDAAGKEPERWLESWEVEQHLTVQTLRRTLDLLGAPQVGLSVTYRRSIPEGVGLGDREARVLAGVFAAWAFLGAPESVGRAALARIAGDFGISDLRVETALAGGLVVRLPHTVEDASAGSAVGSFLPLPLVAWVDPVALVPGFTMGEDDAADLLPRAASFRRAAGNAARAAALTALLTGAAGSGGTVPVWGASEDAWRPLVVEATADDIVQVHRRAFAPASVALSDWLRERGLAAFLSGRGPAVVALWPLSEANSAAVRKSGWEELQVGVADGLRLEG